MLLWFKVWKKDYGIIESILKEKYPDLYKDPNEIPNLPVDFPKCFPSTSIRQVVQFAKMEVENGKHILLVGNEEIGVFKEIEEYIRYKNNSTSYFKNKYNDVSYDDEISNHDFSSASNDSDSDSDSNSKNGKESDENNIIKIN